MMLTFRVIGPNATKKDLSILQALMNDRNDTLFEDRLFRMGRERAWVPPGHFYVLAMDGAHGRGFVHCRRGLTRILVDSYYTHSQHRHEKIAAKLTYHLMGLSRSKGLKSVVIPHALSPILALARRLKESPRSFISRGKVLPNALPERIRVMGHSVHILLRSPERMRNEARSQSRRRSN